MTSSSSLQDAVAHKLQYYMSVKRREEDFDTSTRSVPISSELVYLKTQPMINFTQTKDRSLKHYFTPRMIRTQIAKLEAMPPGTQREKDVREKMLKTMKRDTYEDLVLAYPEIHNEAYYAQVQALKAMKRDTSRRLYHRVDHGTSLSRRTLPPHMTRREANRIVDHASQILVATETVALAQEILNEQYKQDVKRRPQSAPVHLPSAGTDHSHHDNTDALHGNAQQKTGRRKIRRPRYCWDLNGRRVPVCSYKASHRRFSSSQDSSSVFDDNDTYGYEKRQMRPMSAKEPRRPIQYSGRHNLRTRPVSADVLYATYTPRVPSNTRRGLSFRDELYAIDMATQTVQDVGLQTDMTRISPKPPPDIRKYNIKVWTGDKYGAGTRADIYVVLHGEKCKTEEIFLTKNVAGTQPFKKGQVDEFNIEVDNVGKLKYLGIGHDQNEKDFSWYIDAVEVRCGNEVWECPCKRWFSGKVADKKTFRFLRAKSTSAGSISLTSSASSLRSHGSQRRNRMEKRKDLSSVSSRSSRSRSSSSSKSRERPKTAWGNKKNTHSRRSSSSSRSSIRVKESSSKDTKAAPSHRRRHSSSSSRSRERSEKSRSSKSSMSEKKKSKTKPKKLSSSDTSGSDSGKRKDAKSKTPAVKQTRVQESSPIEYSSDSSRPSAATKKAAAESIVEESVDSSDSDSTTSPDKEALKREALRLTKNVSDSESTISTSSSSSGKEDNYSEVLQVADEINAPLETGSSFSDDDAAKDVRRGSIFETFDAKEHDDKGSSSSDDHGSKKKDTLLKRINERKASSSSSSSSDDDDNGRGSAAVVAAKTTKDATTVPKFVHEPQTFGNTFETGPIQFKPEVKEAKSSSSSNDEGKKERKPDVPVGASLNQFVLVTKDKSSSSSSSENESEVRAKKEIRAEGAVTGTVSSLYNLTTEDKQSSSSSSDDEATVKAKTGEASFGFGLFNPATKNNESSSSSSEDEREVREKEEINAQKASTEGSFNLFNPVTKTEESSSSSGEDEAEVRENKETKVGGAFNLFNPVTEKKEPSSSDSSSEDEAEVRGKEETKSEEAAPKTGSNLLNLVTRERKSSSSSSASESEIKEEIAVHDNADLLHATNNQTMYGAADSSQESSSSSSSDEEEAKEDLKSAQDVKSKNKKVSVASHAEEFPTALSMAFPIENENLQQARILKIESPQTAEVKAVPEVTGVKKEASESDAALSPHSEDSDGELLSSSSSSSSANDETVKGMTSVTQGMPPAPAAISYQPPTTEQVIEAQPQLKPEQSVSVEADVHKSQRQSSSSSSSSSSSEEEDFVLSEHDIYHAIQDDDLERVQEILKRHPQVKNDLGEKDQTPLQFAAAHGKLRMLRFLASSGSDYNMETMTGYTAMHLAAMNGHTRCLMLLKSLGVGVESRNVEGQSPLHLAALSGQLDAVKWLVLNGADDTARDNAGRSVITLAKTNHHKAVVDFIAVYRRKMNRASGSSSSSSSSDLLSSSSSSESEAETQREVRKPRISVVQREQEELAEKRRVYEEQHKKMTKRRISFLDEIRMETEQEVGGDQDY